MSGEATAGMDSTGSSNRLCSSESTNERKNNIVIFHADIKPEIEDCLWEDTILSAGKLSLIKPYSVSQRFVAIHG